MAKITKVPDGPLIKKTGKFKGSTLKAGGKIKKAQNGESFTKDDKGYTYTKQVTRPEGKRTYQGKSIDQATAQKIANFKIRNTPSDSLRTVVPKMKKAQDGKTWQKMSQPEKAAKVSELKQKGGIERVKQYKDSVSTDATNRMNAAFAKNAATRGMTEAQLRRANKKPDVCPTNLSGMGNDKPGCSGSERASARRVKAEAKRKNGGMIKRADGSTSQRGLWDNIRAAKGSGKKPTAAMLKQEKKIKAKTKK